MISVIINNKNKGFTLIELLAVIVIIALLASIAIYFSAFYKDSTSNQAEEISYTSIENAARDYAIEYKTKEDDWFNYSDEGLLYICVSVKDLINTGYLNNKVVDNEKIFNTTSIMIIKNNNDVFISEEIVTNDNEFCQFYYVQKPSVSFENIASTNNILVNANCETGNKATINHYLFKINDNEYIDNGTNSSYTFNNLSDNTPFKISVKCINSYDKENEIAKEVSTYELKTPKITYDSDNTLNKSKTASVKFDNNNVTTPYNLIKVDGSFSINKDIYECEVTNSSINCSDNKIIKGTNISSENKWFYINGEEATITFTGNSTFSARLFDGYNYKDTETYNITNIDNNAPILGNFIINNQKYNTVSNVNYYSELGIKISAIDNESGINSAKYCMTSSSKCTPNISTAVTNDNIIVQYNKSSRSEMRVCVMVTDYSGNSVTKCDTNSYIFDNTPPTNVMPTYAPTDCTQKSFKNQATENDGYVWKLEFYYGESANNLKLFNSYTTTSSTFSSRTSKISDRLETKKKYYYKLVVYNRAGLKTESSVIEFTPIYNVKNAYYELNQVCSNTNYYNKDGYFVKYGGQIYAMFNYDKYTTGYKGILAGQYKKSTWYDRINVLKEYVNILPSNYQNILYASKAGTGYGYWYDCRYDGGLYFCKIDRTHVEDSFDISGYAILPEVVETMDIGSYEWGIKNFSLGNIYLSSTHSSGYWGNMLGFGYKTYRTPQTNNEGDIFYGYNAHINEYCMNSTSCNMDYDGNATMYVRPVLVFKEGYEFLSGNGTYEKPFLIES